MVWGLRPYPLREGDGAAICHVEVLQKNGDHVLETELEIGSQIVFLIS